MTPDKLQLKRATNQMLKAAGGLDASAALCRVGKSKLGQYQSPNEPYFVAIDVVADLEPLTRAAEGWPHVTHALCAANGGVFVELPDVPASRAELLTLLAGQTKESSELTQAICDGLSNGTFCARDAAKALVEAQQLLRASAAMCAELEFIVKEGAA